MLALTGLTVQGTERGKAENIPQESALVLRSSLKAAPSLHWEDKCFNCDQREGSEKEGG